MDEEESEVSRDLEKVAIEIDDEGKEQSVEAERQRLLAAVANADLNTLDKKVAWLLNHHRLARDSDVTLLIEYWKQFEAEYLYRDSIELANLYKVTRLTSISRARAKIQNTYKLFLATPEVRQKRGTLSDEEREKATQDCRDFPVYAVYADESKSGENVVVGSMWILDGIGTLRLVKAIRQFKEEMRFAQEFHFKNINQSNLSIYLELISLLKQESVAVGFKAISVSSKGLGKIQRLFEDLFYHLLMKGVEHEHSSGRAPLPRYLQLWKDAEQEGLDQILLANLKAKIESEGARRFNKDLLVDEMRAIDSKHLELMQIADLFTSAVARRLNSSIESNKPKDQFAQAFFRSFGLNSPQKTSTVTEIDCIFYESI